MDKLSDCSSQKDSYLNDSQKWKYPGFVPSKCGATMTLKKRQKSKRNFTYYPRFLFFCAVGVICFYQLFLFLQMYFKYPTSVYLSIEEKTKAAIPGITICDATTFRRSALEEMIMGNATAEAIEKAMLSKRYRLVTQQEQLIRSIKLYLDVKTSKEVKKTCKKEVVWLFLGSKRSCWCLNPIWRNATYTRKEYYTALSLNVFLNAAETTNKTYESAPIPSAYLYLHNDDYVPGSKMYNIRVIPGTHNSARFSKTTVFLLKPPYQTMCKNYTEDINYGNFTTILNQQTCEHDCVWNSFLLNCKCIPSGETVLQEMEICDGKKDLLCNRRNFIKEAWSNCSKKCPAHCKLEMFDFFISFTPAIPDLLKKSVATNHIDTESARHVIYSHFIRFSKVEVFSNVGGYLGIWLGFSFPLVYNQLEKLLKILLRRWKNTRELATSRVKLIYR